MLEGRFRDASFCCARSEFAAIERSFSPPCEGGVRGGEQGITNTFDRSGEPCPSADPPDGSSRTRTAYQDSVPPGPPPLPRPSHGGEKIRSLAPSFHRSRQKHAWGWMLLTSLMLIVLTGASDPEIVGIPVPAKEISKYLPAGTELKVMSPDRFSSLVSAAIKGSASKRITRSPRLIRARHHARWNAGVLSGRTELVIEAAGSGPSDFVLEPWTPAILPDAQGQTTKLLGARDSGLTSLWIDQSPIQTIALDWELKPRSHPHGRSFTLALPGDETTVLALEVPKDWIPSSRQGRRRGPRPAGDPNRYLWEIEAESGRIDLHLYDPDDQGESYVGTNPWLSSTTQIDLRGTSDREGGLANWTTDWRVELDPRNLKHLEVELDPGLELIDVQGPSVRGYRTERSGSVTRLNVTVDGDRKSSTELRFLAHVQVPTEGSWTIPAIRPINAIWTGGTTTVVLDELHVLQQCREKAGRRIFPSREDLGSVDRLEFESESPRAGRRACLSQARGGIVVRGSRPAFPR